MRKEIFLGVKGMTCNHCKMAITKALSDLDGVEDVSVDLAENSVQVSYDPEKTGEQKIAEVIKENGYEVL